MLHQVGLYIHMVALIVVGGGSVGGVLVEKQLWKKISVHSQEAKALLPVLISTELFILIGIVAFLLSGLIMLYSVNWVYLSQPWFIVKFVLFLMLPLRGALIGKPTMVRIGKQVREDMNNLPVLMNLKSKMDRFHIIQYCLVAIIIFLVIFKL